MTDKKFLVPVLALVAFGLPAVASVTTYCSNASPTCTNSSGSFDSSGLLAIDFTSAAIVSNSFTDSVSGTAFFDYLGGTMGDASDALTDTGFQIHLPANTLVFALDVGAGSATTYIVSFNTDSNSTFTNLTLTADGSPDLFAAVSTTPITNLTVYRSSAAALTITNFELQGTAPSDTPEVGTLLLIGVGLLAMRWMRRWQPRPFRALRTAC